MHEVKVYDSLGNLKRVITVKKTEYPVNKTAGIPYLFSREIKEPRDCWKTCKNTGNN
jgi:hypothetical protein